MLATTITVWESEVGAVVGELGAHEQLQQLQVGLVEGRLEEVKHLDGELTGHVRKLEVGDHIKHGSHDLATQDRRDCHTMVGLGLVL